MMSKATREDVMTGRSICGRMTEGIRSSSSRGLALLLFTGAFFVPGRSEAQQFTVRGGDPFLTITTGTAQAQPAPVQNTSCSLRWKTLDVVAKITVATSCPSQHFSLSVLAINVNRASAAPEVNLLDGMPAADFITDIQTGNPNPRNATLQYTASATYEQGNSVDLGNDVHTVTYTLVAQ